MNSTSTSPRSSPRGSSSSRVWRRSNATAGWSCRNPATSAGTSQVLSDSWKATVTVPRVRVEDLAYRGQAVVQLVQHRVDMLFERRPGSGKAQDPPTAPQQGRADLGLEPVKGPGQSGLADPLQLAHFGDCDAVGDLLEPAQHVRVHIHEPSALITCQIAIGRMDLASGHWMSSVPTTDKEPTTNHAKAPRWRSPWAAVRRQTAERQARKALEKDISTYVSKADQAELYRHFGSGTTRTRPSTCAVRWTGPSPPGRT